MQHVQWMSNDLCWRRTHARLLSALLFDILTRYCMTRELCYQHTSVNLRVSIDAPANTLHIQERTYAPSCQRTFCSHTPESESRNLHRAKHVFCSKGLPKRFSAVTRGPEQQSFVCISYLFFMCSVVCF